MTEVGADPRRVRLCAFVDLLNRSLEAGRLSQALGDGILGAGGGEWT
jgi:hypothetical protein